MFDPIEMLTVWMAVLAANSVLSGVVFLVVLFITSLSRRRAPALHVALWGVVLIRLVLPPGLGHPFAAGALVERFVETEVETGSPAERVGREDVVVFGDPSTVIHNEFEGPTEPWSVFGALWIAGFLGVGAVRLRRFTTVRRVLGGARRSGDSEVLAACERWRLGLQVRRDVRVLTSASGMSPFTIGVVRPLIYLPQGVVDDPRCMEAAMAHEMAHVARFDALWLGLQNVLQAAYFFNPVVWIAGSRLNHAREQLCDATVVAADRLAARDYVGGLLNVLRLELRGLGAPAMTARKRRIGMRILNIFEREGGPRPMVGGAVLVSAVFGFFLLPLGSGSASAPPAAAVVVEQTAQELQPGQDIEFVNPLPDGRMTWSWGPGHRDPFTGEEVSHKGIDLAAPNGTSVTSPADGVVLVATEAYEPSPGSGTVILIDHGNGIATFFAHLGSLAVIEGQEIDKGAVIATVGSTGKSTGPHLHFEVRKDGEAVDPANYVEDWN